MQRRPEKSINHAKHLAFQIVAQLPEDEQEALQVLKYAKRLLLHPLEEPEPATPFRLVKENP